MLRTRTTAPAQRAAMARRAADPLSDPLSDPLVDPLATAPVQRLGAPVQRIGSDSEEDMDISEDDGGNSSDSDYEEEDAQAPPGYMDPSDYHDEFGGSDHSALDGVVWVRRLNNWPALWWQNPNEEVRLQLTGTRAGDIVAAGGNDVGYTWHHCADYAGGYCTLQQVPTAEHSSWGHYGGARQAGYGEDG